VSNRPIITADGKSSEQSLDKDEFPIQANGKIIERDFGHKLLGDILEDSKSTPHLGIKGKVMKRRSIGSPSPFLLIMKVIALM
jgi:hypothetical protein